MTIYIDADACTVKDETYKVAKRYGLKVILVANQFMRTPSDPDIEMKVVGGGFDAADDWIVEQINDGDILITSDLLLADKAIKKGARVLGSKGKELDEENIGSALAHRELGVHLRQLGHTGTGPSAMNKKARSEFLASLDRIIQQLRRR